MLYLYVKWVHIISSTVLMGTGIGIAFFMLMAHRTKNAHTIAQTASVVVWADTVFTAPAVLIQLGTGLWLTHLMQMPLSVYWVKSSLMLFGVVVCCWLPVVWLQITARNLARRADAQGQELPPTYFTAMRWWFVLGWPAFVAMLTIFWLMVAKPG